MAGFSLPTPPPPIQPTPVGPPVPGGTAPLPMDVLRSIDPQRPPELTQAEWIAAAAAKHEG